MGNRNMSAWWVVGGNYAGARVNWIAGTGESERYGPFDSYDAARGEWRARSGEQSGRCNIRYRIVEEPHL